MVSLETPVTTWRRAHSICTNASLSPRAIEPKGCESTNSKTLSHVSSAWVTEGVVRLSDEYFGQSSLGRIGRTRFHMQRGEKEEETDELVTGCPIWPLSSPKARQRLSWISDQTDNAINSNLGCRWMKKRSCGLENNPKHSSGVERSTKTMWCGSCGIGCARPPLRAEGSAGSVNV